MDDQELEQGRDRARLAADARRREMRLTQEEAALRAGISKGAIKGFFKLGGTWPQRHNLAAIERALGWPVGSMDAIAAGGEPPDIPRSDENRTDRVAEGDHGITVGDTLIDADNQIAIAFTPGFLAGLSPEERDEAMTRAKLAVQEFVRGLKTRA